MRLFFALWPSIDAAEKLAGIARSMAERFGGKPTRQDTIHLTLAFLGEVPEENVSLLIQSVKGIRAASFELSIDDLGYWHHNHLFWAGSTQPPQPLIKLADDLRRVLEEAGFVVDGAERVFAPHLTLVRKVPEIGSSTEWPAIEPIRWRCSRFALVRSRLSEAGSAYETLSEFSLTDRIPE